MRNCDVYDEAYNQRLCIAECKSISEYKKEILHI